MNNTMTNSTATSSGSGRPGAAADPAYLAARLLMYDVRYWFNVIVIPIGIVGNLLCLLVVCQKKNRSISCSVYIGALALVEFINLASRAFSIYINYGLNHLALDTGAAVCAGTLFVVIVSSQCGIFIIMALLAERVFVVLKPLKAMMYLRPRRAVVVTILLCVFQILYNIPIVFSITALRLPNLTCMPFPNSIMTNAYYRWSNSILFGIIPLSSIVILNAVILYEMKRSRKRFAPSSKPGRENAKGRSSEEVKEGGVNSSYIGSTEAELETVQGNAIGAVINPVGVDVSIAITDVPEDAPGMNREDTNDQNGSGITTEETDLSPEMSDTIQKVRKTFVAGLHLAKTVSIRRGKGQKTTDQRERQMTLMTVVMTLAFFLLVLPSQVETPLGDYFELSRIAKDWLSSVSRNLNILNNAINFFIYVLTGSKFRADLLALLRCQKG